MPLEILRKRLLRTGDLEFTALTASDVDQYHIVVNQRCTKKEIAELWVSDGANPIPKGTLKQLGTNYLICDRLRFFQQPRQSLIWTCHVHWKEIEEEGAQQQTSPTPNSGSIDPEDWTPSWSRRTVIVHTDAVKAYYRSGFGGSLAAALMSTYNAQNPPAKAPIMNSACQPLVNNGASHQRRYQIWSLKWLRPRVPSSLIEAEGKVNSDAFSWTIGEHQFEFEDETVLIDSVNISKQRWGNLALVEIAVDLIHDPEGWQWEFQDYGTVALDKYGSPDGQGGTVDYTSTAGRPDARAIVDANSRHIQDPCYLDGTGQPLPAGDEVVYLEYMDFESDDFSGIELLEEILD